MEFFIGNPGPSWLIGAAAIAAFVDLRKRRTKNVGVVLLAAILWICYGSWEWLLGRTANIRVDLFLIYPVLAFVSALALQLVIKETGKVQDQGEGK